MLFRDPRGEDRVLGLRAIAVFEAFKGLLALAAASGLFLLMHRDIEDIADRVVDHLHLDPASHYPSIFLAAAAKASPEYIRLIALGALAYAAIRLAEAYGLWHDRGWAEWLGVVTGLIYVPFEVMAFVHRPGPEPLLAVAMNIGIVLFLGARLRRRAVRRRLAGAGPAH